jgi:hypothetical protein
MNKAMGPLWQYMGQQQPAQSPQGARQPYMAALERKRRRLQAKRQTQQNEAQILPAAPPQLQPFGSYIEQQPQAGVMPWNVMSRRSQ